jgi:hypothetical protein
MDARYGAHNRTAFSITSEKNSLLGGTIEFCRGSTNSRAPINRKTTESMRRAKMANYRYFSATARREAVPEAMNPDDAQHAAEKADQHRDTPEIRCRWGTLRGQGRS